MQDGEKINKLTKNNARREENLVRLSFILY